MTSQVIATMNFGTDTGASITQRHAMQPSKLILIAILIVFGIQGIYVLSQIGYWGIWINNLNHLAGQQVTADLVIALTLVMAWMWRDAKATGRIIWPWIVAMLILGSFGPLAYLLTRKSTFKPQL
jgi:hypothetical protein